MSEQISHNTLTRRRFLSTSASVAATLVGAGILTACGSSQSQGTDQLLILSPGASPTGWNSILSAVNNKLKDDNIGVSFKIQWIDWNDYASSTLLKTTAGEKFDAVLDAPWNNMIQLITDKAYVALDDQIGKYPNLKASIPQQMWDANKFYGKIYGIPLGTTQASMHGFAVRQDLVEKYGYGTLKTYEDLEHFWYTIKGKEPNIIPFGCDGGNISLSQSLFDTYNSWQSVPGHNEPVGPYNGYDYNAHKATAWWVDQTEDQQGEQHYTDFLHKVRKYYQDGIINQDVLNIQKTDVFNLFSNGKYATALSAADGLTTTAAQYGNTPKNVPGAKLSVFYPYTMPHPKPFSNFQQFNFLCVHTRSQHQDKVLALSDWLSIRANHDLLEYGIAGKDWKSVGDSYYQNLSQYTFPGYVISWRPQMERYPEGISPTDKSWCDFAKDANNFTPSPLIGFTFDNTPVKDVTPKLDQLYTSLIVPLGAGVVDPDSQLAKAKDAFNQAGYQTLTQEAQKQANAFFASKKK